MKLATEPGAALSSTVGSTAPAGRAGTVDAMADTLYHQLTATAARCRAVADRLDAAAMTGHQRTPIESLGLRRSSEALLVAVAEADIAVAGLPDGELTVPTSVRVRESVAGGVAVLLAAAIVVVGLPWAVFSAEPLWLWLGVPAVAVGTGGALAGVIAVCWVTGQLVGTLLGFASGRPRGALFALMLLVQNAAATRRLLRLPAAPNPDP
jgi:hypothetical protein